MGQSIKNENIKKGKIKKKEKGGGDQETTSRTTDEMPGNNEWGW